MVKVKEPPEELQRQKEDIENLLSSLETGFKEGSITQEHYNEVRQKNLEKLEEIQRKLKIVEKKAQKQVPEGEAQAQKPEQEPKGSEPKEAVPPKEEKKLGIPGEVPSKISGGEVSEERLKEKIIMELSPKIEKINIRLVKLKAFVDAMKEDKTGERESMQHINEELGEARSSLGSIEGRLSEMEMKLEDASETLVDLKPQRFAKELQKKEEELKLHEARLEKLDDMNTTILKRVNQIQLILEKLGNIESIANMTKDISKKLVSIDEREKKITRLADKIDNMFVEINKRLEEFMFYKVKQDSLDDLSKEMLKSLDELTTKLTRYAEKDDLEVLRDTLENKINTIMKEGTPAIPGQLHPEQSEMESLMKLLEDQYKKGLLSKKDYEKAREANLQRMKESGPTQKPSPPAGSKETVVEQSPPAEEIPESPAEKPETREESGLEQAAKIAQPSESPATQKETAEPKPEEKKEPAREKGAPVKKPTMAGSVPEDRRLIKTKGGQETEGVKRRLPAESASKPETPSNSETPSGKQTEQEPGQATATKEEIAKKIGKAKRGIIQESGEPKSVQPDRKKKMLADLEYSLRKGLISQKAYETAQKIIMSRK